MSETTKQFYHALLARHGTNCRALSFNSAQTQRARFIALLPVLPADRAAPFSLLDVGCGFGDLYSHLWEQGYRQVDYTGLDLLPAFVAHARERFPSAQNPAVRFVAGDFLDPASTRSAATGGTGYDYVLCSGALNVTSEAHPDHAAFVFAMVGRMYALAHRGVAFNLLSSRGQRDCSPDPRFFYADPDRVLARCRALAPDTELDHDYLSYDFAIRSRTTPGAVSTG